MKLYSLEYAVLIFDLSIHIPRNMPMPDLLVVNSNYGKVANRNDNSIHRCSKF